MTVNRKPHHNFSATTRFPGRLTAAIFGYLPPQLVDLINSHHLADIFSSRNHSEAFRIKRAEYIRLRIRWLTLMFSIAVPLWIPIDYFTLNDEHLESMVYARGALALMLAMLFQITHIRFSPGQTNLLLFVIMLCLSAFYSASILILGNSISEAPLAGYASQPFLLVCFLAIFPLTLLGSTLILLMVFGFYIFTQFMLGDLYRLPTLNGIWMFCLFSGAVFWAQYSQLHMLLQLYRESTCDYLTGLFNRRLLVQQMELEAEHAEQMNSSFSLLMIGLDRFKRINDQYGKSVGDRVLVAFGDILQSQLSGRDLPARYGGGEFMVLLPGADEKKAQRIAEKLRSTVQQTPLRIERGDNIIVTASLGVTEYRAGEGLAITLNRLDEALYQAKKNGRNCVIVKQQEPSFPERYAESTTLN